MSAPRAPSSARSFWAITAPIGGRLAHEAFVERVGAVDHVLVRADTLRRSGARRRRRLVAPGYQTRVVVEVFGSGHEPRDRVAGPYRGVTKGSLAALIAEVGGRQRPVIAATLSFVAQAPRRRHCETLRAALAQMPGTDAVQWTTSVHAPGPGVVEEFTLHARATGAPAPIADLHDAVRQSPWVGWDHRARWRTE